jgi:formate dehydrogenase major subunit
MTRPLCALVGILFMMHGRAKFFWHAKIIGDHSYLPLFVAIADGRVKRMLCVGQNPATSLNASLKRKGLRRLDWLVVKDNRMTETATFWPTAPEVKKGEIEPQNIGTRVFFFPYSQVAESGGNCTNTERGLQWYFKAAKPQEIVVRIPGSLTN